MTNEPAGRGTPASPVSDRDRLVRLEEIVGRLRDSAAGLQKAAALVEDASLTRFLAGLVERREEAIESLVAVAADARLELSDGVDGSVLESLRRGWMELEASIDGDDSIVGTAIDEERDLLDEVDRAAGYALPDPVLRRFRSLSGEISADITGLEEWRGSPKGESE